MSSSKTRHLSSSIRKGRGRRTADASTFTDSPLRECYELVSTASSASTKANIKLAKKLIKKYAELKQAPDPHQVTPQSSKFVLNLLADYCKFGTPDSLKNDSMGAVVQGLRHIYSENGHTRTWFVGENDSVAHGNPLIGQSLWSTYAIWQSGFGLEPTPRTSLPGSLSVTEADVRRGLKSLSYITSPGPDGLRPAVLKTLAHTPGGTAPDEAVLPALTEFINQAIDGNLPMERQSLFAGGTLIGIPKNPTSLRPIAMGILLRRLIGRLLIVQLCKDRDLLNYLLPHQLGFGVSGGCDAIIHSTRLLISKLKDEDLVLLRLDACNAFNTISRQCILDEVTRVCPGIARWIHYLYGGDSLLQFGTHLIWSRNGTQQGDPLGMLLFAIAIHPLILDFQTRFRLPFIVFYADDGTLIVLRTQATSVIQYLQQHGAPIGFKLNPNKTDAWWFDPPIIPAFPCTINTTRAVMVLGSPIGHDDGCGDLLQNGRQRYNTLHSQLHTLQDPQIEYHLLRSCASACLLTYTLRTTPPHLTHAEAKVFDQRQRGVFQRAHRPLSDESWYCATLPTEDGGLGLTPTFILKEVCYISSIFNVWKLVHDMCMGTLRPYGILPSIRGTITALLAGLTDTYNFPHFFSAEHLLARADTEKRIPHLQDEIMEHVHNSRSTDFMPPVTANDRISRLMRSRLLSSSTSEATQVFTTIPNSYHGTRAEPAVWITMVDLRLGNPFFSGDRECPQCQEGASITIPLLDAAGYHAATCPGGFGTTRRHNSICRYLYRQLRRPGVFLTTYREKPMFADRYLPRLNQRRMDIVVDDQDFATHTVGLDVTVVSPHNSRYTASASKSPAGATIVAEARKHAKYDTACTAEQMQFYPVAIDIYGGIGTNARAAFRRIAGHYSRITGRNPSTEYRKLVIPLISRSLQATAIAINRRRLASTSIE